MKLLKYLCIFFLAILFSCSTDDDTNIGDKSNSQKLATYPGGVVLTFDDDYVDDWKIADNQLKAYSWKATFCVCGISLMAKESIQTLQEFQKYGHEIAGHGTNHVNTLDYIATNGFQQFYEDEITPMMDKMNENGLKVTSFAYPYGARNYFTDEKLFANFQVLRGTTYNSLSPENQDCYYENSRLVLGLSIDNYSPKFSMPYILSLLDYAYSHHKILILYSHKPVDVVSENYQTKMENLVSICRYVNQKHMKFYTLSDLEKIKS